MNTANGGKNAIMAFLFIAVSSRINADQFVIGIELIRRRVRLQQIPDDDLAPCETDLKVAGCEKVFGKRVSSIGKRTQDRHEVGSTGAKRSRPSLDHSRLPGKEGSAFAHLDGFHTAPLLILNDPSQFEPRLMSLALTESRENDQDKPAVPANLVVRHTDPPYGVVVGHDIEL
jgi:hypothetical protein